MRRALISLMMLGSGQTAWAADYTPPVLAAPQVSGFDGFYAGLGGAFGWQSQRQVSVQSGYAAAGFGSSVFPLVSDGGSMPNGISGTGIAGVNMSIGSLLLGLEFDGRWGDEATTTKSPIVINQSPTFVGQAINSYTFRSDTGAHVSGRIGGTINGTLIFAKVGVGAIHTSDAFTFTETTPICTTFVGNTCTVTRSPATISSKVENWYPSILAGVGIERNFGRFFGRIGAEFEVWDSQIAVPAQPAGTLPSVSNFLNVDSVLWGGRVNATIGVRF